jgi:hypothetical protein
VASPEGKESISEDNARAAIQLVLKAHIKTIFFWQANFFEKKFSASLSKNFF